MTDQNLELTRQPLLIAKIQSGSAYIENRGSIYRNFDKELTGVYQNSTFREYNNSTVANNSKNRPSDSKQDWIGCMIYDGLNWKEKQSDDKVLIGYTKAHLPAMIAVDGPFNNDDKEKSLIRNICFDFAEHISMYIEDMSQTLARNDDPKQLIKQFHQFCKKEYAQFLTNYEYLQGRTNGRGSEAINHTQFPLAVIIPYEKNGQIFYAGFSAGGIHITHKKQKDEAKKWEVVAVNSAKSLRTEEPKGALQNKLAFNDPQEGDPEIFDFPVKAGEQVGLMTDLLDEMAAKTQEESTQHVHLGGQESKVAEGTKSYKINASIKPNVLDSNEPLLRALVSASETQVTTNTRTYPREKRAQFGDDQMYGVFTVPAPDLRAQIGSKAATELNATIRDVIPKLDAETYPLHQKLSSILQKIADTQFNPEQQALIYSEVIRLLELPVDHTMAEYQGDEKHFSTRMTRFESFMEEFENLIDVPQQRKMAILTLATVGLGITGGLTMEKVGLLKKIPLWSGYSFTGAAAIAAVCLLIVAYQFFRDRNDSPFLPLNSLLETIRTHALDATKDYEKSGFGVLCRAIGELNTAEKNPHPGVKNLPKAEVVKLTIVDGQRPEGKQESKVAPTSTRSASNVETQLTCSSSSQVLPHTTHFRSTSEGETPRPSASPSVSITTPETEETTPKTEQPTGLPKSLSKGGD